MSGAADLWDYCQLSRTRKAAGGKTSHLQSHAFCTPLCQELTKLLGAQGDVPPELAALKTSLEHRGRINTPSIMASQERERERELEEEGREQERQRQRQRERERRIHTHTYIYIYIYVVYYLYTYVCIPKYILFVCAQTVHASTKICTYVCVCMYMYVYIYIHTYLGCIVCPPAFRHCCTLGSPMQCAFCSLLCWLWPLPTRLQDSRARVNSLPEISQINWHPDEGSNIQVRKYVNLLLYEPTSKLAYQN